MHKTLAHRALSLPLKDPAGWLAGALLPGGLLHTLVARQSRETRAKVAGSARHGRKKKRLVEYNDPLWQQPRVFADSLSAWAVAAAAAAAREG